MKKFPLNILRLGSASLLALPLLAHADVKISDVPLDVALNKARTVIVIDDSGSMDFEIQMSGKDGKGNVYFDGVPFWDNGSYVGTNPKSATKSPYVFPLTASSTDADNYFSSGLNIDSNHVAVPALPQYAHLRSPDFNSQYYNPRNTYVPWPSAMIGGKLVTYTDSPVNNARVHPGLPLSGTPVTFDLEKTYFGTGTVKPSNCSTLDKGPGTEFQNWTFKVFKGMALPYTVKPSGISSVDVCIREWNTTDSFKKVASGDLQNGGAKNDYEAMIPYNPASFWMETTACASGAYCADADNGKKYQLYDINSMSGSSYTLPDGTVINRSKAQELQNFANWFTFYRKRSLMMASGMAVALNSIQKNYRPLYAASIFMHNPPTITWGQGANSFTSTNPKFYDFTSSSDSENVRPLLGMLYTMKIAGGTPTYAGLEAAGNTYRNDVQGPIPSDTATENALKCSANSAFVLTDGYATDVSSSNRLYDLSKKFYDNLRSWKPEGTLKTVNTYGVTLGALGEKFGTVTTPPDPTDNNLWPTPEKGKPSSIDDLWRATLYSKGKLLSAKDPATLETSINTIITSMFASGTGSGLAYSGTQISSTNNVVIQAGYDSGDWSGDLAAFSVYTTGPNAGYVNYTDQKWSAKELLETNTTRHIATWNGKAGIPFTSTALNNASLLGTFNTGANNDAANVVAWLRGDRTLEGSTYRQRSYLLGDIVNSTPAYVNEAFAKYNYAGYSSFAAKIKSTRTPMVYVGANDGMLHAFRASDGQEMWAYVPKEVHPKLNALAQPSYTHQFTVDGQMTAWDVEFAPKSGSTTTDGSTNWRTVLIGGLRGGGKGFYALDVTNPDLQGSTANEKETDLAGKVLWEFTDPDMGYSFGKPQIGKTESYGWVALLTSGYNNRDGKGYLYVVKIEDGSLIRKIPVDWTTGAYTQVGLADVTGIIDFTSTASSQNAALLKYAYGGDLNGNLWRFNIRDADKDKWSVKKLAANLNGAFATGKAPITAAPDVALINTPGPFPSYQDPADLKTQRLMVFVGNGKLLHGSDFDDGQLQNGFYAIEDADDDLVIGEGDCSSLKCLVAPGLGQGDSSLGLNNWKTPSNDALTSWWITDKHSFTFDKKQRVKRGWYIIFSETGNERMIHAPQVFNGKVLFTTTMKSDSRHTQAGGACEPAFSALYNLSADKGGEEDGYRSRVNLGFGIASGPSVIQMPDGGGTKVTGSIKGEKGNDNLQCADGKCNFAQDTGGGGVTVNGKLRRFGWKEIYR